VPERIMPAWLAKPLLTLRNRYVRSRTREWLYPLDYVLGTRRGFKSASKPLRLHLGCGRVLLPGWVNIDKRYRPGVAVMRLPGGLRRIASNSVAYAYCSHILEHVVYPGEAMKLTSEIRRVLVPGGAVRFVVPGIERIIRAYVADDKAFFKEQEGHHPPACTTKLEHLMYALQQDGSHKYGYDFETAKKLLLGAGFSRVINSEYNQSEFTELRVDYRGENLSLFVDAVK
jgi:predicted SAM-dependent methyltransferase